MIWNKKPIASENVREMAEKFGLSFLEASILLRRGIYEPEEMPFYLEKDLSFLNNPFLFDGMEDAVDRVLLAKEDNEKVYVFGDRDVGWDHLHDPDGGNPPGPGPRSPVGGASGR
jgi:single-stranded-DNA-specific exonuclease